MVLWLTVKQIKLDLLSKKPSFKKTRSQSFYAKSYRPQQHRQPNQFQHSKQFQPPKQNRRQFLPQTNRVQQPHHVSRQPYYNQNVYNELSESDCSWPTFQAAYQNCPNTLVSNATGFHNNHNKVDYHTRFPLPNWYSDSGAGW